MTLYEEGLELRTEELHDQVAEECGEKTVMKFSGVKMSFSAAARALPCPAERVNSPIRRLE